MPTLWVDHTIYPMIRLTWLLAFLSPFGLWAQGTISLGWAAYVAEANTNNWQLATLVGYDAQYLYLITSGDLYELMEEEEVEVASAYFFQVVGESMTTLPLTEATYEGSLGSHKAGILRVSRAQIAEGAPLELRALPVGNWGNASCLYGESVFGLGLTADLQGIYWYSNIEALDFYNDLDAFRLLSTRPDLVKYGAPMFSKMEYELQSTDALKFNWMGMLLKTNSTGGLKLLKPQPIVEALDRARIPHQAIQAAFLQQYRWQFTTYVRGRGPLDLTNTFIYGPPDTTATEWKGYAGYVTFEPNGRLSGGVARGTYCVSGDRLVVTLDTLQVPAFISYGEWRMPIGLLRNVHPYKISFDGTHLHMFDGYDELLLSPFQREEEE